MDLKIIQIIMQILIYLKNIMTFETQWLSET